MVGHITLEGVCRAAIHVSPASLFHWNQSALVRHGGLFNVTGLATREETIATRDGVGRLPPPTAHSPVRRAWCKILRSRLAADEVRGRCRLDVVEAADLLRSALQWPILG